MNEDGKVNPVVDIILPAVVSLFLFTSTFTVPNIPIIGRYLTLLEICSLFSPLPIVYTYLKKDKRVGLFTLVSVLIALAVLLEIKHALIFFVEYGILAVIISESIKQKFSVEKTVLFCVAGSLAGGTVILLISLLLQAGNPYTFLVEQMKAGLDRSLENYISISAGGSVSIDDLKENFEQFKKIAVYAFPAFMIIGSITSSLLNYATARYFFEKYIIKCSLEKKSFSVWHLPDHYVWGFIVAGFLVFLPMDIFKRMGINFLIIISVVYFLQGLSITHFFYKKIKVSNLFQRLILPLFIVLMILTAGPFIAIIITGVGLFDTWADFRKIRNQTQTQ